MNEIELRRIVREEIARAIKILHMTASDQDDYDTPELTSRVLSTLEVVARAVETSVVSGYHGRQCNEDIGHGAAYNCESEWALGEDN